MVDDIMLQAEERMERALASLGEAFGSVRTGRASALLLDRIKVDYYGVPTPVNQMAAVSVPDARTILIAPWDKSTLKPIEKAIQASDIGINPTNDGSVIRIVFPPLTEERRKEICKQIKKQGEEAKVAIRAIRRDANEKFKALKKSSEISEDDQKDLEEATQKMTDKFCKRIDETAAKKEKEILEI